MSAFFVTATGTDIGKTFVTAGLVRHLRAAGKPVHAIKPVVSGYDDVAMAESDPGLLLAALGRPINKDEIAKIAPWRFAAALSPDMAAAREGKQIDFDALVKFCRDAVAASQGTLFIEGVGGVMVPLDVRHTVLDWMAALRMPVILVTGSYLGTLSHTLTALEVLRARDLQVAAQVINESAANAVSPADTAASIKRFAPGIKTILLTHHADNAAFARAAEQLAAH
jgi:dethiobiotin synthetase